MGLPHWPRFLVVVASALIALVRWPWAGLTQRPIDPWRRTLGLGLRSEAARFGLASLGLKLEPEPGPPDVSPANADSLEARFVRRWRAFLDHEPDARATLHHTPHLVERAPLTAIDVVQARFESDGRLTALHAELDPRFPAVVNAMEARVVEEVLIDAHAATRAESDRTRHRRLVTHVTDLLARSGPAHALPARQAHAVRLTQAAFVSFAPAPGDDAGRFEPPDFRRHRDFGASLLNAVVRLDATASTADLWLSIHHTGADGAPMQEMLSRLEQRWGRNAPAVWPAPDDAAPPRITPLQCSPDDRPIHLLIDRFDFTPLIRWRTAANRRWGHRLGEPIPLPAVLIWHLAQQPAFAGRAFSTAVDVPGHAGQPRAVDLVALRPADYAHHPEPFLAFARDYGERVARARRRRGAGWRAMRALALLPPALAARALEVNQDRTRATFGTVGVTVLKEAGVFIAPMADAGWADGFLALGQLTLPAAGGGTVGFLTAKGTATQLAAYPAAVRQALADCSRLPG